MASTNLEALNDVKVLRQKATVDLPALAKSLVVNAFDQEAQEAAQKILQGIKLVRGKINDLCDPSIEKAKDALEAARALKAELDTPSKEADRIIREKLRIALNNEAEYRRQQEAKAAEQRRLEAAAQKKIEDDARKAKEEAAKQAVVEEFLPRDEPRPVTPAPVPQMRVIVPPKPKGSVTRWHARVINAALVPREYLIVDQVSLNRKATDEKEKAVGTVPGVEFYSEEDFRLG